MRKVVAGAAVTLAGLSLAACGSTVTKVVPGPTVTVTVNVTVTAAPPADVNSQVASSPVSAAANAPAPAAPAAPETTPAPPAGPSMTTAQQQAVDAAQGYLSMGEGFSYQGLLQQLTSSAGNGFATPDAEFAINYLHPDWDAQAVEAAKGYLQMGGFSRASLIQQLTSSAGNGFTEAQAEYAANQVGL